MAKIIEEAIHNGTYTLYIDGTQPLEPENFLRVETNLAAVIAEVLINPRDLRDVYVWDINVTGWMLHEMPGNKLFLGGMEFKRDIDMTQGLIICKSENGSMAYIVKDTYEWLTT